MPKNNPTPTDTMTPSAAAQRGTEVGKDGNTTRASVETIQPKHMPIKPPRKVSTTASVRNCTTMSRLRAPTALRMPISRVRSVTAIIMMAMTPTPPTINATDDSAIMIAKNAAVKRLKVSTIWSWRTTAKLLSSPGPSPRRVRSTANRHAQVVNQLQHKLGRKPEDREVAESLGVTVDAVRDEISVSAQVCVLPINDVTAAREVVDGDELASDRLERAQLVKTVREALGRLPERDALVLSLYYIEGLSYQEVGQVIGVSESRVCQLCGRAIKRLRDLLGDDVA